MPTPSQSWDVMFVYWALAAPLFPRYMSSASPPLSNFPLMAAALAVTILQQVLYFKRTTTAERPLSLFALVVFPVVNGVLETFLFFLAFDTGVHLAPSPAAQFLSGFLVFSLYSGLIRAFMWDKLVFPKHINKTSPISLGLMLEGLTLMSFTWMLLYFKYRAVKCVILLHILTDICACLAIHLPPPWDGEVKCEVKTH